jgi:hypothetical protein
LAFGTGRETFSAWATTIVFAVVAMFSFAVDQTVSLPPATEEQGEVGALSLLPPVQLIETLIGAASK